MNRTSDKAWFTAALAAGCVALALLSAPAGPIELIVTSTGLSESIPAAAPPLGSTARLLLAGFGAIMAAGVTFLFARNTQAVAADGEKTMGFALSKLTAFARGRGRHGADGLPVLRRADAHPDAPARRPIFASRDFQGIEFFKPSDAATMLTIGASSFYDDGPRGPVVDGAGLALPNAPEPLPDAEILRLADQRIARASAFITLPAGEAGDPILVKSRELQSTQPVPVGPEPIVLPFDSEASVADLSARFERGLARRIALREAAAATDHAQRILADAQHHREKQGASDPLPVLADIPPAPPVTVRKDVEAELDEALRNALGTLHRMTSRAG